MHLLASMVRAMVLAILLGSLTSELAFAQPGQTPEFANPGEVPTNPGPDASDAVPANPPPPQSVAVAQPGGVLVEGMHVAGTGGEDDPKAYLTFHTPYEYWLTLMTVGLLGVSLLVLAALGWRSGLNEEFARSFIVVVIVFAALFLISAGYSDKQAAPVYGLLGTIVGYVFGRLGLNTRRSDDAATAAPAPAEGG